VEISLFFHVSRGLYPQLDAEFVEGQGDGARELAGVSDDDVAVAEQATEAGCVLKWALKSRQSSRRLAAHFVDLIKTPRLDASRCGPTRRLALSFVGAQLIAFSLRCTQS
jgi:hypothetical protein